MSFTAEDREYITISRNFLIFYAFSHILWRCLSSQETMGFRRAGTLGRHHVSPNASWNSGQAVAIHALLSTASWMIVLLREPEHTLCTVLLSILQWKVIKGQTGRVGRGKNIKHNLREVRRNISFPSDAMWSLIPEEFTRQAECGRSVPGRGMMSDGQHIQGDNRLCASLASALLLLELAYFNHRSPENILKG